MTNRSRCALMSRGSRLNSNSLCSVFSGFSSSSATAGSGSVIVATETRSPKFCFMNSVILDFNSSGEGNGGGGGGFCAMCRQTSSQRGLLATLRLHSDPPTRRLFKAFSCREKVERRASATNVGERPPSPVFVAPHQVRPEVRHTKKNAVRDQARSFAAKRA